jgi:2-dehydro-3-deoxy-D-gluconate 5-dehydrogenase
MGTPFDLHDKIAVITGANTGLGQAIAVSLAEAGADIVAVGRSEPVDTLAIINAAGRRAAWIPADLDSLAPIAGLVERARSAFGHIDILVNNAGAIRRNAALDFTEDDWDAVIGVNLKTAFFLTQAVARYWVAEGTRGKVINIASMLSFQGGVRVASYTASKSGLLGITRLLANEWAARGISVNAIAPGYFATNNTEALRNDRARNNAILERIPAGRWGDPRDLGGAAVFLASRASDYVHGAVIPVDGGWLAR